MDFRLKVFASVAHNLSFTKAAQELFVSQPAVTKHIRELEAQYGIRLFSRMGSRIALTEAGRLLLEHATQLLDDYARLDYDMNLLRDKHTGTLRIGASTTIAQYVLPPLLADFTRRFTDVSLSLLNSNSIGIENALLKNEIDLGLVEGGTRNQALSYTTFMQDELVAVAHKSSALAKKDELTLDELRHVPLVLRERGSGTLEVFRRALAGCGLKLSDMHVLLYLGSTESIKRFLENANCLGIVSIRAIDRELLANNFKVIELPELPMPRTFDFVQLQGQNGKLPELFMHFAERYGN